MGFKRGETFNYAGPPVVIDYATGSPVPVEDFTGWSATSQMRTTHDTLVANLEVTWLSRAPGMISLTASNTQDWPIGVHLIDIRFVTPSGEIVISPTRRFPVEREITRLSGA